MTDLVLSAGWLAFGRHLGFLDAVVECGIAPQAIVGTSSGSMVGALFAAGWSCDDIAAELFAQRPLAMLRPSFRVGGLFSMDRVVARLSRLLPARIEDLPIPFAVGVVRLGATPEPVLLTRGPLALAIAASCAVPGLFAPVLIDGARYWDGGWKDRTGLASHARWRPDARPILHLVRSRGEADDDVGVPTVHSAPSGARLIGLGDAPSRRACTRAHAVREIRRLQD